MPSQLELDTQSDKTSLADHEDSSEVQDLAPPDGGYQAWLMTFGLFAYLLVCGGYTQAWGTFQAFYETDILQHRSSSNIAWIGSLQYALQVIPGVPIGRLYDGGHFYTLINIGFSGFIIGSFLIAECRQYYQFLLCQGILMGASSGFIYVPAISLIPQWFTTKRPLVFAVGSIANALGGVIYPIAFRKLEPVIGFRWTVRAFACFITFFIIMARLTMRPRIPPARRSKPLELGKSFRSPAFVTYTIAIFLAFVSLFTPSTFVTTHAEDLNFSESLSFYMTAILNGSSIIGRATCGVLAVRYGALNTSFCFTTLGVAFLYAWGFTVSKMLYIIVTCFYGIALGGFLSVYTVPVYQMGPLESVGSRTGLLSTFMGLGSLIGPPISGAIRDRRQDYRDVSIYAGTVMITSCVLMVLAKRYQVGSVLKKMF